MRWTVGFLLGLALLLPVQAQDSSLVPSITTRCLCADMMFHAEGYIRLRDRGFAKHDAPLDGPASAGARLDRGTVYRLREAIYGSTITKDQAWQRWGNLCIKRIKYVEEPSCELVLEIRRR